MAKINMVIRGIEANLGAYPKDTFAKDLQALSRCEFIMAPFSLSNWAEKSGGCPAFTPHLIRKSIDRYFTT